MSGFFYIDESDHDERLEERKKEDEAQEIATETLELVSQASNDLFPAFLWEPQLNEFEQDDAYLLKASCTNPAVLRAYTLGKKYQDYWSYVEAMDAYIEYAKYIEAVYGDFAMMARASKEGYGVVFIPSLPKLTHKKKNKLIIESGFMPSQVDTEFLPPEGSVETTINLLPHGELVEDDPDYKLPKSVQRIQANMIETKNKLDRVNSIYSFSTGAAHQGMDAIINFLTNSNSDDLRNRGKSEMPIAEMIEDLHTYDHVPPEIAEWMALPQNVAVIVDGIHQNKAQLEYRELIKVLENNGYDFLFSSATESMDKDAVRALHREFQDIDIDRLPKKLRKKYKKQLKEKKKQRREILASDRRLQSTLLHNRVHLESSNGFAGINPDFINFHLSDAFPMGDE